jgi:hypothetical protein
MPPMNTRLSIEYGANTDKYNYDGSLYSAFDSWWIGHDLARRHMADGVYPDVMPNHYLKQNNVRLG